MSEDSKNGNQFNGPSEDDERDLINSEFESIVAGLSLDESAPTSYLDQLDEFEAHAQSQEREIYTRPYQPPHLLQPQNRLLIKWAGGLFLGGVIYAILVFGFEIDLLGFGTYPSLFMFIAAIGLLIYANLRPSDQDPYDDGSVI